MELRYSLTDLEAVAEKLLSKSEHKTWLFDAPMGAGKTTLIKSVLKKLGVVDPTHSPTFSIVNEYQSSGLKIYHFDLYRLKTEAEAYDIGLEEYFEENAWCFIEWPELAHDLLPEERHLITIQIIDEQTRVLNFE